jgi:hypothetical protein
MTESVIGFGTDKRMTADAIRLSVIYPLTERLIMHWRRHYHDGAYRGDAVLNEVYAEIARCLEQGVPVALATVAAARWPSAATRPPRARAPSSKRVARSGASRGCRQR